MPFIGNKPTAVPLTSADITDNIITSAKIADGTIASADLASNAVDTQALSLFNASGSAPVYACRAWVNFNGSGTPSIRASGNVTSITDNATGDFTVNFTTAMPDANYSAVSTNGTIANSGGTWSVATNSAASPTTSAYRLNVQSSSGTMNDNTIIQMAFFR